MNKLYILTICLALAGSAYADDWIMEDGGVYWTENGYTIRAYPAIDTEPLMHVQYINFTSVNPASRKANISFVFSEPPTTGVFFVKLGETWTDMSGSFYHEEIGQKSVYTARNIQFDGSTNHETRLEYMMPSTGEGKYDIYVHAGSPTDVINEIAPLYVVLDPWWNSSFSNKIEINITNWHCSMAYCQFPIPLTLNATLTNGSAIRVLNSTETGELVFWREDGWNYTTASGNLWVNASNQTTKIFIYYNASGATDKSTLQTFQFGDDFNSAFNATKWTNDSTGASTIQVANGSLVLSVPNSASAFIRITMAANMTYTDTTARLKVTSMSNYSSTVVQMQPHFQIFAPGTAIFYNSSLTYRTFDITRYIGQYAGNGTTYYSRALNMSGNVPEIWTIRYNSANNLTNNTMTLANGSVFTGNYTQHQAQKRFRIGLWRDASLGWAAFDYMVAYPTPIATPTFAYGGQQAYTATANLSVLAVNGTASGNQTNTNVPANYSLTSAPLNSSYNFTSWTATGNCTINAQTPNTTVELRGNCNATASYYYVAPAPPTPTPASVSYVNYSNPNVTGFGSAFDYSKTVMTTATGFSDAFGLMVISTIFLCFYIVGSRYTQERALVYSSFMTVIVAFLLVSGNFLDPKWLILMIIALLAAVLFASRVN